MASLSSIRTPTIGLGTCIAQQQFVVPNHQRDYSWTVQNVKTFIEDLEREIKQPGRVYFCGLMVFTQSSSKTLKVLDGQQRLATTLMIFSAIRNWLKKYGAYNETEVLIGSQLLTSKFIGRPGTEAKLTLTAPNNTYFKKYVIEAVAFPEIEKAARQMALRDRSKNLMSSVVHVNRHIEEIADKCLNNDRAHEHFVRLIEYLSEDVRVVELVLDSDAAAYTIFETLNDRGLELSPLDLIKNYLFSKAGSADSVSLADLEGRWADMMTLLGSVKADTFLRAFWASRFAAQEGNKLFREFKKFYPDADSTNRVSLDLRRDAERYSALFNVDDPIWADYSGDIKRHVKGIAIIEPSQIYPVILAALEKFDKRQMLLLMRLLEVIGVRFQLVGKGRPGRIESTSSRVARGITGGEITTAQQVREAMNELYILDPEFRQKFRGKSENDADKARYLLLGIERQSLLKEGSQYADELDGSATLTLEHIFPKSYKTYWGDVVDKDPGLPKMLGRLGNMCLLANANTRAANKSWPMKVEVYCKSRLRITNLLTAATYPIWDAAAIEKRQDYMADLALAAWRWQ